MIAPRAARLDDLRRFVAFRSVAADPARRGDVHACARWLAGRLRVAGLREVRLVETPGHPVVVGRSAPRPGHPLLLIYGHYDVQPAAPGAFALRVEGGRAYGRGACDDKGQVLAVLHAIESWRRAGAVPPVDVLLVVEGEEETGSANLPAVLRAELARRTVAGALALDAPMVARGVPTLVTAMRGALTAELEVRTGDADQHSGQYGGAIANAVRVASGLAAGLAPVRDGTRLPPPAERAALRRPAPDDRAVLRAARARVPAGTRGFTLHEATTLLPSLELTGVAGGHAGPGVKAELPSRATAKLDVRLAPGQEPETVRRILRERVAAQVPDGVAWRLRFGIAAPAVELPTDTAVARAAAAALERAFGRRPVPARIGGTVPAVGMLARAGVPVVLTGLALPDSGLHGPDEHLDLDTWDRGTRAITGLLACLVPATTRAAA